PPSTWTGRAWTGGDAPKCPSWTPSRSTRMHPVVGVHTFSDILATLLPARPATAATTALASRSRRRVTPTASLVGALAVQPGSVARPVPGLRTPKQQLQFP